MRCGVNMDFELGRRSTRGYESFDALRDAPIMSVRAGGAEAATAYLNIARNRHNTTVMGSWYPFSSIDLDLNQPQADILYLGGNEDDVNAESNDSPLKSLNADFGLRGHSGMQNLARYIAVAARNASTTLRHLNFAAASAAVPSA